MEQFESDFLAASDGDIVTQTVVRVTVLDSFKHACFLLDKVLDTLRRLVNSTMFASFDKLTSTMSSR
jgi:hypothetical protein